MGGSPEESPNMCGIFGLVVNKSTDWSPRTLRKTVDLLFQLSESRGKEAAGLAIRTSEAIHVYKEAMPASQMIADKRYKRFFQNSLDANGASPQASLPSQAAILGHSRLVTNGLQGIGSNNQPVVKGGLVGVHNGIIVNDACLWEHFPQIQRQYEVDTEVILALLRHFQEESGDLCAAVSATFQVLEGSASVAIVLEELEQVVLATNTGSLYLASDRGKRLRFFASELFIAQQLIRKAGLEPQFGTLDIEHVRPGQGMLIDTRDLALTRFSLGQKPAASMAFSPAPRPARIRDASSLHEEKRRGLRRCTRCVLPETMPFIAFDQQGVCSYCRDYQPLELKGAEALRQLADRHRRDDGKPDCIVAMSGGRDSCYGLHYVKRELGLNPVAYSYDWGMITDLGRRNQARLCGRLGVENILISADIKKKRKNIQRNVLAWLKKPHLGMIPLFMAGDKQYFYHANQLRKQMGLPLVFLMANQFEKTDFKTGFTGIKESKGLPYEMSGVKKLAILRYYMGQFLKNPAYVNASLPDTLGAFYSSYALPHDYLWLFDYIPWDEESIHSTLRREYDWEVATDTQTTWRIGDGTAAFYNYIYYTVAGFSEHDTFRSNQIRAGLISREEAMAVVERDNQPRYESIREYSHMVGFDADEALRVINQMPKLYG
jgi:hypothetical protein